VYLYTLDDDTAPSWSSPSSSSRRSCQNPTYASESSYAAVMVPPALPVLTTPTGSNRTA